MSTYKGIEKVISDLEWRFTIALYKSREDGDPIHRQKIIKNAAKTIKRLHTIQLKEKQHAPTNIELDAEEDL